MKREDLPYHNQVSEKLIEQLKQGTAPWQKPYTDNSFFLPINPITHNRYKGINAIILLSEGRDDPRWMTYKQAQNIGAQVRKGEKGTRIQYWKFEEERVKLNDEGEPILAEDGKLLKDRIKLSQPRLFVATVFNAQQINNLPALEKPKRDWDTDQKAEELISLVNPKINHNSNQAYYLPKEDTIFLPRKENFLSSKAYYATALHELAHWTGHESRLNRDLHHPFGSDAYAKEELRAEIASLLISEHVGIGYNLKQHASYVASWIRVLENDYLEIFRAAADAEKIQSFLIGLEQEMTLNESLDDELIPELKEEDKTQRRYINVPFNEKDEAKKLGARFDKNEKSWYVPSYMDITKFSKWDLGVPIKEESLKVNKEREYLVVPYSERVEAKAFGAFWDKEAKAWYIGHDANRDKLEKWIKPSISDPREEFKHFLVSLGCSFTNDLPLMDGQKQRVEVKGDKLGEKSGFYVGFLDGRPAGYFKNYRTGKDERWRSKSYNLSEEQKIQLELDAQNNRKERKAENLKLQAETAKRIGYELKNLFPCKEPTPYLKSKGIEPSLGVFTDADNKTTYVPVYTVDAELVSMQYIREDGTKRFAKNGKKEGAFHIVGGFSKLKETSVLVIAEGYATAATLSAALNQPCIAAFDAGNLLAVAKAFKEKYPSKEIVIAGDDDRYLEETQGVNIGKKKAEEAAKAIGGRAIFPVFAPNEVKSNPRLFSDFNDLATSSVLGMEGVRRQVDRVLREVKLKVDSQVKKRQVIQRKELSIRI
jgi:putative DNA primase/helicase